MLHIVLAGAVGELTEASLELEQRLTWKYADGTMMMMTIDKGWETNEHFVQIVWTNNCTILHQFG